LPRRRRPPPHPPPAVVVQAIRPEDAPVTRWLQLHLGQPRRSARELARRLQHARGAERKALIAELAAVDKWGLSEDSWAWPPGTSDPRTISARATKIAQALADGRKPRLMYDQIGNPMHGRPIDLEPPRWELWLRHRVRVLLQGKAYRRRRRHK
jgi:hypothetical protein